MECNGCTACCRWLIYEAKNKIEKEFFEVRFDRNKCRRVDDIYGIEHACPWLEAGKCGSYNVRPLYCRTFKPGSPLCLVARKLDRKLEGYDE